MPQITVDYSEQLTDSFDRGGLALALHTLLNETVDNVPLDACKARFVRTDTTVVGAAADGHDVVHLVIGLLPGRPAEVRARLSEAALELVRDHVKPTPGRTLHASAEVRELDVTYRKFAQEA
ncbi:5-carboxymethyl-2-hydroxymuconate Delta-isomerase [Streptomyces sp. NPDC059009]|uniref:5-carboxymethyl-2-hydroxymuconate Delta-isomerase n=1 Tax=Streptomyces sp. NPDC059009 TaxID=3346694 RepID=UPI0036BDC1D7